MPSRRVPTARHQPLAQASAALDIRTGGGEVLAGAFALPPVMVATAGDAAGKDFYKGARPLSDH